MKVAFIAQHDGYNVAILNLIKALMKRNHVIHVFADLNTEHHLHIFKSNNIQLKDLKQATLLTLDFYDAIFAQNNVLHSLDIINVRKYVYSISDNVFHEARSGADFIFSNGEKWKKDALYPFEKQCVIMEASSLKISETVENDKDIESNENIMLFIDSGHMPYSARGKKELAKLLINICKRFENYRLIIKPRILPGSKYATHRNDNHLYDNINELCGGVIPSNMTMLMEHLRLGELIRKSKVVVCLYTTAYLEAVLLNKNIVIIDGLPNEDTINARYHSFFDYTKNILSSTGCLVPYTDVLDYLPNGVKCSEEHVKEQIYSKGYVADSIAEVMEFIHDNFISKEQFPYYGNYQLANYKEVMLSDPTLGFDGIIQNRFTNCLRYDIGGIKRNLNCFITSFDNRIDKIIDSSLDGVDSTSNYRYKERRDEIIRLFIEHRRDFSNDDVTQSYLIYCRLVLNNIKEAAETEVLNENMAILHYARGLWNFQKNSITASIDCFEKYLITIKNNTYDITIADRFCDRVYIALIILYMNNGVRREDLYKEVKASFLQRLALSVLNGETSPGSAMKVFLRANIHYLNGGVLK